jgi:uncharacterized protein (TIGR02246 family)
MHGDMAIEALAVIDEMIARWNHKDAEAFAAMFVEDADFTDVLGQTAQGRAEIAAQHQPPFSRTLRDARLSADLVAMRTLGSEAAVARVHWSLADPHAMDGSSLPTMHGKMQVTLLRGEAGWQIVAVLNQHATSVFGERINRDAEI